MSCFCTSIWSIGEHNEGSHQLEETPLNYADENLSDSVLAYYGECDHYKHNLSQIQSYIKLTIFGREQGIDSCAGTHQKHCDDTPQPT